MPENERNSPEPAAQKPWYRHVAWISPTVIAVVFAILIAGALGVRQVIIRVREPAPAQQSENADPSRAVENDNPQPPTVPKPNTVSATVDDEHDDLFELNDAELEVLPAPAAQEKGRRLPKMLLVGRDQSMFPTLEAAFSHAIPRDVIEIRHDGLLEVEPGKIVWPSIAGPITLRAGKGYRPVIVRKSDVKRPVLIFAAAQDKDQPTHPVVLKGLTIVELAGENRGAVIRTDNSMHISDCLFLSNTRVVDTMNPRTTQNSIIFQNCYFMQHSVVRSNVFALEGCDAELINNLFVDCHPFALGDERLDANEQLPITLLSRHNTYFRCPVRFAFLRTHSRIESRDNLVCFGGIDAWMGHIDLQQNRWINGDARDWQKLVTYTGENNFFFSPKPAGQERKLTADPLPAWRKWQGLTHNGEMKFHMADPGFVKPVFATTKQPRMLPPHEFALRPGSPVHGAATDGKDIGCDLSQIPTPPPLVEKLVAEWLQAREKTAQP